MMRQVGIHDYHEIPRAKVEAVDVCSSKTELASARFQNDLVLAVGSSQLPRDLLRAIRAVVVDDNHLPVEVIFFKNFGE